MGTEQGERTADTKMGDEHTASVGKEPLLTRRRFSVDDYYGMARVGILTEDDRVELLDGEVVAMTPIGSRHASCVARLTRVLTERLGRRVVLWPQNPVRLDRYSEPEPDVSLLKPRDDLYAEAHPTPADVLLVVEVADASLAADRSVKTPLYAKAGIPEVWLVNLNAGEIEVYRQPSATGYSEVRRSSEGSVRPLAFPDEEIAVEEIIGPGGGGQTVGAPG